MDSEQYALLLCSPYALVIPGVDQALALKLRQRAELCLDESEKTDGYIEAHPALVTAIDMDQCYEFTVQARTN